LPYLTITNDLSVAGSRSGRERTSYPVAEAAGQEGRDEVLSQTPQGLAYVPHVIITDKLKSYGAAKRVIRFSVEHRQ